ncbi:MAG: hypothetical protein ABT16_00805 [Rhodanobacter sp. SCN 65-17]|nr:MAG: hypothetical protein ABT16_00805 [Rhodanobacter sp. SCN 65-17]
MLTKRHLLRELDRIAIRLLDVYPEPADFWQAYGEETIPLYRRLSIDQKAWLFDRLEATLALHGMPGAPPLGARSARPAVVDEAHEREDPA